MLIYYKWSLACHDLKNGRVYVNIVLCHIYMSREDPMDIHQIWTWTQFFTHGFFHGRAKTVFMDMDMDLILFNPIQTRPIAILRWSPPWTRATVTLRGLKSPSTWMYDSTTYRNHAKNLRVFIAFAHSNHIPLLSCNYHDLLFPLLILFPCLLEMYFECLNFC